MSRGRRVLFACALLASLTLAGFGASARQNGISDSTDIALIEKTASPPPVTRPEATGVNLGGGSKDARRVAAYVRLGKLGTPESLAALGRVELRWREIVPAAPTYRADVWTHPAWHFTDTNVGPLATARDAARGRVSES